MLVHEIETPVAGQRHKIPCNTQLGEKGMVVLILTPRYRESHPEKYCRVLQNVSLKEYSPNISSWTAGRSKW